MKFEGGTLYDFIQNVHASLSSSNNISCINRSKEFVLPAASQVPETQNWKRNILMIAQGLYLEHTVYVSSVTYHLDSKQDLRIILPLATVLTENEDK